MYWSNHKSWTNKDYSIEEIIKLVGKILNKKIYIKKDLKNTDQKSEVDRLLSNNNKAKNSKMVTRSTNEKYFIEYLRQTINWYKK